jgi:hypothetical protein
MHNYGEEKVEVVVKLEEVRPTTRASHRGGGCSVEARGRWCM